MCPPAEIEGRNIVLNSENVPVNEHTVSCKEQHRQRCKRRSIKINFTGRKFYIQKIPQLWLQCRRLSRPLSYEFKLRIFEHLGQVLNNILRDLVTMKHKINNDRNRIWKMEKDIANANVQHLVAFSNDNGPSFQQLVEMAASNEDMLRCIGTYADMLRKREGTVSILYRLSLQVKGFDEENELKKSLACVLLQMLTKLDLRIQQEAAWVEQSGVFLQDLFGRIVDALSKGGKLEDDVLLLKIKLAEFVQGRKSNFELREIIEAQESIKLRLENFCKQLDLTGARIKNLRSILNSKMRYFLLFTKHHEYMSTTYSEIKPRLVCINNKLVKIMKMYDLTIEQESTQSEESFDGDEYAFQSLKKHELDLCFSWRTRLFHNRPILSPVRFQSAGTCSYHATLSTVESLYKWEYAAYPTLLKDIIGQSDEFLIDLSREQLEDIVEDFKDRHKMKGSEKLNICLDRMQKEGVCSEETYRIPQMQRAEKYKIKEYEEIDLEMEKRELEDLVNSMEKLASKSKKKKMVRRGKRKRAKNISEVIISSLLEGRVMLANFWITTKYFRLSPHEIYRIPERNAQYEVNKKGVPFSHCVVVVGYGVRNGQVYLIYQNSYGKSWGLDGFGRIYLDSIRLLYLVHV